MASELKAEMFATYVNNIFFILMELSPWLLLGAAIAGLLHLFISNNFIARHLGQPGFKSTFKAALIGVPMPLCSCSVIPTAIGLKKSGAGNGAAVSFLVSTPQTGVDAIAVTAGLLGWPFTLYKVGAAFITGIVGGLLAENTKATPQLTPPTPEKSCCASTTRPKPWFIRAWNFAFNDIIYSIWRWLVFGILLSALLTTLIEPNSMQFNTTTGLLAIMGLTLLISIPMYVCDISSVPIAAAMVAAGLPTGAALVFLMAGPATNIATIGAVGRSLGRRALIAYISTVVIGSMLFGISYEWLFNDFVVQPSAFNHQHNDISLLPLVSTIILMVTFLWFFIRDMKAFLSQRTNVKKSCCR